jgi:hypothetical protein
LWATALHKARTTDGDNVSLASITRVNPLSTVCGSGRRWRARRARSQARSKAASVTRGSIAIALVCSAARIAAGVGATPNSRAWATSSRSAVRAGRPGEPVFGGSTPSSGRVTDTSDLTARDAAAPPATDDEGADALDDDAFDDDDGADEGRRSPTATEVGRELTTAIPRFCAADGLMATSPPRWRQRSPDTTGLP